MRSLSLLSVCALLFVSLAMRAPEACAQETASHRLLDESRVWVEGTSNKNDWTVEATEFDVVATLVSDPSAPAVRAARVVVPAARIVSEKSTIMDRLMHQTLEVDTHPQIVFEVTEAEPVPVADGSDADFAVEAAGPLTIAGETRAVTVSVEGRRLDGERLRLTGSHPMRMTDHGMRPPSAMFGALRTGDEVTVNFDLLLEPIP